MSQQPYTPPSRFDNNGGGGYPPQYGNSTEKDWMGIVSIIGAFFFPLLGVIFGHMGMKANREGQASNEGLTKAGLVLSYVFLAIGLLFTIFYFVVLASAVSSGTVTVQ